MFSSIPSLPAGANGDAFQALSILYPTVYEQVKKSGYEWAGPDMVGRCHQDCTLFLHVDHEAGLVKAWAWLVKEECYLGPVSVVRGPMGPAVEKAMHLVESFHAESYHSGGVPHYREAVEEEHHAA